MYTIDIQDSKSVESISSTDAYWLNLCNAVSAGSSCLSRKMGAVVVNNNGVVLATGFNSTLHSMPDCKRWHHDDTMLATLKEKNPDYMEYVDSNGNLTRCPRVIMGYKSGEGLEYCPAIHAERNCISSAASNGVNLSNTTMYCNFGIPCFECMKSIANSGINRIVVTDLIFYDDSTDYFLSHSYIMIRQYGTFEWCVWNEDLHPYFDILT